MSDQNMDRYLELFLEESTEQIDLLNDGLLRLEKEGPRTDIVEDIFRSAHTLKSSAAFVGQDRMSELAHRMEDLLQQVREGKLGIKTDLVNLFFQIMDRVRASLVQIANGEETHDDFGDLKIAIGDYLAIANQATSGGDTDIAPVPSSEPAITEQPASSELVNQGSDLQAPLNNPPAEFVDFVSSAAAVETDSNSTTQVNSDGLLQLDETEKGQLRELGKKIQVFSGLVRLDADAAMRNMRFLLLYENLGRDFKLYKSDPAADDLEGDRNFEQIRFIVYGNLDREKLTGICQIDMVEELLIQEIHLDERSMAGAQGTGETRLQSKNIKVASEKIDYLMNNVGELVIINSGLQKIYEDLQGFFGDTGGLSDLKAKIDQAERIARDLQSGIMKTRMMPVGLVFHRFARPVRDLARQLEKEVELTFEGEDTELDKNIIDALGEPLLHIMRNSIDHGLESPEERFEAGKDTTGNLHLSAYQSGNNIFIEIRDDGRGLNKAKILQRATEKGILSSGVELAEEEIYQLVFHPGFSTADKVTDISGRGVGMSVVKKMVEEFKGSVQVINRPGEGCSILLSFPLTLAIVASILVRLHEEEYAFPLADVVETIRVTRDEITSLQGKDIINLRGDILPVFHLSALMGLPGDDETTEFPILIASSANRKVGFIVDGLTGKKEIVIKSLEQNFRRVPGLIGACLMGDGNIIMVLDVHGLLEMAQGTRGIGILTDTQRALLADARSSAAQVDAVRKLNQFVNEQQSMVRGNGDSIENALAARINALDKDEQAELAVVLQKSGTQFTMELVASLQPELQVDTEVASSGIRLSESPRSQPGQENNSIDIPVARGSVALMEPSVQTESAGKDTIVSDTMTQSETSRPEQELRIEPTNPDLEQENGPFRELSKADFDKLQKVVHNGMDNAGEVLSQLLGVSVRVSVPEFRAMQFQELAQQSEGDCFAVRLPIEGAMEGMNLLVFDHQIGRRAAGELMGMPENEIENIGVEDIQSVLCELGNIVGSSILNEFSNTTGETVMPGPPEFFEGSYKKVIEQIQVSRHLPEDLQILYIMTDFYRQDVEFFGRMYVIPTARSLARILNLL